MDWLVQWISGARDLAHAYGVDPIVFIVIYVGAIPFFWLGTGWIVRAARRRQPLAWPVLFTGSCFVSPYLYVLFFGRGLPWWSYAAILALLGGFGWQAARRLRQRVAARRGE